MKRTLIAPKAPRRMHDFLVYAKAVAARIAEDPLFQPPPPSLPVFEADVAALEAALVAQATRGAGLAAARHACERKVRSGLDVLVSHIHGMTALLPSNDAAMVIERAGLNVKDARGPSKDLFVVKPGPTSGTAHAYVRAAKSRASYEWQYSSDGVLWLSIPTTVRADARFVGLVPGTLYWFRYRTVTKEGISDWSAPFSFRAE